jgi:serine/threonine-protein kinase
VIGRTVLDKYIIRRSMAEGGFGEVYEAEHLGLGSKVALEVLGPARGFSTESVERFHREAVAVGKLTHPAP